MKSVLVDKIVKTDAMGNELLMESQGRVYTFLNPVSYLYALKNKSMFAKFDGIFADGSILVSAIRLLYGYSVTRRSFDMTSLAPVLLRDAEEKHKSLYIVASKQEQVEKAVGIFKKMYPKLIVAGYRNGYFTSDDEQQCEAEHIVKTAPDFLIVGMGALIQENFLLRVKNAGYCGIGFTCGGFIHQTAKDEIEYYPKWADRLNLRFIYRMYKEPHTRKRYLKAALLFPAKFIKERFF